MVCKVKMWIYLFLLHNTLFRKKRFLVNLKTDIDQGIHKGKMKVALNEKQKKLCGFSFSINIANFEALLLVFKLTKNLFFWRVQCVFYTKVELISKSTLTHFFKIFLANIWNFLKLFIIMLSLLMSAKICFHNN